MSCPAGTRSHPWDLKWALLNQPPYRPSRRGPDPHSVGYIGIVAVVGVQHVLQAGFIRVQGLDGVLDGLEVLQVFIQPGLDIVPLVGNGGIELLHGHLLHPLAGNIADNGDQDDDCHQDRRDNEGQEAVSDPSGLFFFCFHGFSFLQLNVPLRGRFKIL